MSAYSPSEPYFVTSSVQNRPNLAPAGLTGEPAPSMGGLDEETVTYSRPCCPYGKQRNGPRDWRNLFKV